MNLSRLLGILGAMATAGAASTTGALSVVLTAVGGLMLFFSNPKKVATGEKKLDTPTLTVALLVASLGLIGSCAHVTPTVVDCGKEVSAGILPAVESALVAQDYVDELTKLVGKFGECVIRKAVEQVTGEALKDSSFAAGDTNARVKFNHGSQWLAAHPAR